MTQRLNSYPFSWILIEGLILRTLAKLQICSMTRPVEYFLLRIRKIIAFCYVHNSVPDLILPEISQTWSTETYQQ